MAGATVVNLNPLYAERELKHLVKDSGTEILITLDVTATYFKVKALMDDTATKALVVCSMADALPFFSRLLFSVFRRSSIAAIEWDDRHVAFRDVVANDGSFAAVDIDPQSDVAVLQYTGGTTGVPKGAMLTHANIAANARQVSAWYAGAERGDERFLAALPFFHVFAMTVVMLCAFECRGEIIMMPRFDLKDCLRIIHRKRPTVFPAVPTIYTAINNSPDVAKYDLTSIKLCISGGAPLPVEVKRQFENITGCIVVDGYGLSETSPAVCTNPTQGNNKPGSVGLPMPGDSGGNTLHRRRQDPGYRRKG